MQEANRRKLTISEKVTLLGVVPYGFLAELMAEVGLQKSLGDDAVFGMLFTISSLLCAVALFAPEEDSPRARSKNPVQKNNYGRNCCGGSGRGSYILVDEEWI